MHTYHTGGALISASVPEKMEKWLYLSIRGVTYYSIVKQGWRLSAFIGMIFSILFANKASQLCPQLMHYVMNRENRLMVLHIFRISPSYTLVWEQWTGS